MADEKWLLRSRLRRHSPFVINEVIVDSYLTELHAAGFLSDIDKGRISDLNGRQKKQEFVDTLMHKDEPAIQKFLDIARSPDNQPQIYAEVMSEIVAAEREGTRRGVNPDHPVARGFGSTVTNISYSTHVQDLIGDHPSQCIIEVSKVLDQTDDMGDDWRRLWSELLDKPLNEEVASQKKEGPTHFVLKLWCRMKPPSQATVEHLVEALNSIQRNDVARIVQKYCKVVIPKKESPVSPLSGGSELTEAQLDAVAKVGRDKWQEIGIALGFKMEELTDYEEKKPKSLQRRLFCLLVDWKKSQDHPTAEALISACTRAGVGGEVKRVL